MKSLILNLTLTGPRTAMVALLLAAASLTVSAQDKKDVSPAEMNYEAAGSPLANEPMYQSTNPKSPKMTQAEFDIGRKTYFERCAGCHGVLRARVPPASR